MPYKDLRTFIRKLEQEKEAVRIEEAVDWNLEAGAMLRRCHELNLPSPFFQKIKGYPEGYRLFGAPLSKYRRIAIAMDLDADTHPKEIIEQYLKRTAAPIKPVLVKDGPCKENIRIGDQVDLFEFPVPFMHEGDGGRYIGTFHLTIAKEIDGDWVNWGMYRHMLHNRNTVGVHMSPLTHQGRLFYQHYEPKNKAMEIAIAIGVEPISTFFAASPVPYGVSEADMAGALRGEPVELIKCETLNLTVPASAEIVIEGEIRPNERMDEGPFGEYTGYVRPGKVSRPVIHVKAVTYRNDPILTMSCVGIPVDDNLIHGISGGGDLLRLLRARGLPISSVCIFPETSYFLAAVSVKTPFANVADEIAHVIWASRAGSDIAYIIVVEDDVDPFNMGQVLHAVATKCHPFRGIVRSEHATLAGLSPWANLYEQKHGVGGRTYFDCTWPGDWDPADVPVRVSFSDSYPPEIKEKALATWRKYGY